MTINNNDMKLFCFLIITTFLAGNLTAEAPPTSRRDPFWPIGYTPPPPKREKPKEVEPKPAKPEPPPPPQPKPISEDEWKVARKLLKITGYALSRKKSSATPLNNSLVIINRKHYSENDLVKLEHNEILFVWRVGEIGNNTVNLMRESATRNPR